MVQNSVKIPVYQMVQNSVKVPRVSAGSEQCEGPRVPKAYVYTQDRDRFRPLKRRVEVSMRDLSREDRDTFQSSKTERVGFVA